VARLEAANARLEEEAASAQEELASNQQKLELFSQAHSAKVEHLTA